MSHANPEAQFLMGTSEKWKKEGRVAKEVKVPHATLSSSEGSFPKSTGPWRYPEDK